MLPSNPHHHSVIFTEAIEPPLSPSLEEQEDDEGEVILKEGACRDDYKNATQDDSGDSQCFIKTVGSITGDESHKRFADRYGAAELTSGCKCDYGRECSMHIVGTTTCMPGSNRNDDRQSTMSMFDANGCDDYDAHNCSNAGYDPNKFIVAMSSLNDRKDFSENSVYMFGSEETNDTDYDGVDYRTVSMLGSNVHNDDDAGKPTVRGSGSNADDGGKSDVCIQVKQAGSEERQVECCCRVCHLGAEMNCVYGETMKLGCGCKNDLGIAHKRCAEAWFKIQGHRVCEICGSLACNIVMDHSTTKCAMSERNDLEANLQGSPSSTAESYWKNHRFSLLLVCTIMFVMFMWLVRVTLFR